jgi:hypothetical protein
MEATLPWKSPYYPTHLQPDFLNCWIRFFLVLGFQKYGFYIVGRLFDFKRKASSKIPIRIAIELGLHNLILFTLTISCLLNPTNDNASTLHLLYIRQLLHVGVDWLLRLGPGGTEGSE